MSWTTSSIRITYSQRQLFFCLLSSGGTQIFYDVMRERGWQSVTGRFPSASGAPVIGTGPGSLVEVIPPLLCGQPGYLQGSTHETIAPFDSTTSFQLRQTALGLSNGVQSVTSLNHDLSLLSHSINIYFGDNNIYCVVFL